MCIMVNWLGTGCVRVCVLILLALVLLILLLRVNASSQPTTDDGSVGLLCIYDLAMDVSGVSGGG